jgi:glucan biosynthesis protein
MSDPQDNEYVEIFDIERFDGFDNSYFTYINDYEQNLTYIIDNTIKSHKYSFDKDKFDRAMQYMDLESYTGVQVIFDNTYNKMTYMPYDDVQYMHDEIYLKSDLEKYI